MSARFKEVDIAKGIAIILVVLGHAFQGVVSKSEITVTGSYSRIYIAKMVIYGFHMPLFVLISGLFIGHWVKRPFKKALSQKIKGIVWPYFLWSFLLATIMQVGSSQTNGGLGIQDALRSWYVPFSEYWYLYFLFIVCLIYFVVVNYFEKGKLIFLLVSIIAASMSAFVPNVWVWSNLAAFSVFFAIGAYVGENLQYWMTFFSKNNVFWLLFAVFIIVNIVYVPILLLHSFFFHQIYWYLTSFVGLSFVFAVSTKISGNLIGDKLSKIGKHSMEIYVSHLIPLAVCRIVLYKILGSFQLDLIVWLSFFFALIMVRIFLWIVAKLRLSVFLFGR